MQAAEKIQHQAVLKWVRPPQQARTRATLNRLLDAAEELLAEKSFQELGIAEVARVAHTSIGGFYRRFRDKDGLLHALHERFCEDARATTDESLEPARWAGAPLVEILDQVTAFLVQIHLEREGLFRAFLIAGVTDETVRARTEGLFQYIADRLHVLLEERRDEMSHPAPDTAADVGLRVVLGSLDLLIQLQPKASRLDIATLTAELARVLKNYLGARAS